MEAGLPGPGSPARGSRTRASWSSASRGVGRLLGQLVGSVCLDLAVLAPAR